MNKLEILSIENNPYFTNFFLPSFELASDGLSIIFILLTALVFPLYILSAKQSIVKYKTTFILLLFLMQGFLFLAFLTCDIFIFYFAFECLLIPMTFIILHQFGNI